MTDPETLSHEQCKKYVRQLQKTVRFWQRRYASLAGFESFEEFVKTITGPKPPVEGFKQEY